MRDKKEIKLFFLIVVGILGHGAILEAMKTLSATAISILNASQLIVAPILAYFILKEPITLNLFIGGSFVFIAFSMPLFQKKILMLLF